MVCKNWFELDSPKTGELFEFCKKNGRKCFCAGKDTQCSYPGSYEPSKQKRWSNSINWSEFVKNGLGVFSNI